MHTKSHMTRRSICKQRVRLRYFQVLCDVTPLPPGWEKMVQRLDAIHLGFVLLSPHVSFISFSSPSTVLRQLFFGRPGLRFPGGVHLNAALGVLSLSILRTQPSHLSHAGVLFQGPHPWILFWHTAPCLLFCWDRRFGRFFSFYKRQKQNHSDISYEPVEKCSYIWRPPNRNRGKGLKEVEANILLEIMEKLMEKKKASVTLQWQQVQL